MVRKLKAWLMVGLLLATAAYCVAEEFTLTTYYPSPRGVYQELKTAGDMVVGDITNPPGARLHVVQDGTAPALRVDDAPGGDTSPFVIDATGNVGIGTASPGQPLHVIGDARIEGALKAQSFGSFSPLLFKTLDVERMRIDDTGNVGIGTASPDPNVKLDVNGAVRVVQDAAAPALRVDDALGDTSPFVIDAAGNVGIGTASPDANVTLDVNGAVKVGDSATGAAGALRWNSGQLQVHDGSQWNNVGIPSQVQMTYVSGANPGCPVGSGGFLLRKWSGVSCGSPQCGICSTPNSWLSNIPVCTTAEVQDLNGICGPVPCTATAWTEAVCLGN